MDGQEVVGRLNARALLLKRGQNGRVQRHGMRPTTLGPWNTDYAVQKVHVLPPQAEETARRRPVCTDKRRYVITERGRLLFDVMTDQGLAKDIPPAAHRRFRSDLRAKEERNCQDRAEQLALHEEKNVSSPIGLQ